MCIGTEGKVIEVKKDKAIVETQNGRIEVKIPRLKDEVKVGRRVLIFKNIILQTIE